MQPLDSSIRIRCTADEASKAKELADVDGTTVSDFLRTLIRQLHAKRITPTKKRRAR